MQEILETWVPSLDWEDPLEKEMATYSSILAWKIPWTEEPGGPEVHGVTWRWIRLSTHARAFRPFIHPSIPLSFHLCYACNHYYVTHFISLAGAFLASGLVEWKDHGLCRTGLKSKPPSLSFFFFNCKVSLLMITLYYLLPIFDVTNFRVFEICRILICNWHNPLYLSSLNPFCDFFLFLPTKTCYVPPINASSKWRNKLG